MKRWLSVCLVLCLCLAGALAEELPEDEETLIDGVDAEVAETTFDLGGDDAPAPEEYYIDDGSYTGSPDEVFDLGCPDIYDVKYLVSASDRVYPGTLVWPLPGNAPLSHLSSHVGWRNAARIHRGQGGDWASWLHHGIDVSGVTPSQLVVAADSGVAYAGEQQGNGKYVVIDHGNGFYTKCQHLSRFAGAIFAGCRAVPVQAGDPIGYVGSSGGDYPVHFHFEIAWSPYGPGSDDAEYHEQTHNRDIYAYSFDQQCFIKMHWPQTWELCSAEYQTFVSDIRELDEAADEQEPEDPNDSKDPED